ncbi:hypothetical protein G8764_20150 [Pseudomaricurvus alcaniphilus]|uniref:hypothetical protein n=1 Tax=Pseudomaricurvus alcaniphilus TaxID=1166482 RepID=UPI001407580D|nr:hypothetical protein [Pseudomaricurvus alcaniphilus]NHN39619.1 hypothetical protein [Pseudomaricurvus alcaniphilus]
MARFSSWFRPVSFGACTRLLCALALCSTTSPLALAQSAAGNQSGGLIFPSLKNYYNPLKHGSERKTSGYSSQLMDNETLLRSAQQLRSDTMTQEQRALNHQWLVQGTDDSAVVGSKVFSTLMKMGFKTYWEGNRVQFGGDNRVLPNDDGDGRITDDMDYKVRFSGDKIKLSLEYEF